MNVKTFFYQILDAIHQREVCLPVHLRNNIFKVRYSRALLSTQIRPLQCDCRNINATGVNMWGEALSRMRNQDIALETFTKEIGAGGCSHFERDGRSRRSRGIGVVVVTHTDPAYPEGCKDFNKSGIGVTDSGWICVELS
ncbi:hypothetical protein AVEN_72747-1 [Araneus ventricosus]|uniref:Uncharacterized protein n=1 Tax=Araneus ventricosus TaxID=182803 RepID=A0A4Y2DRH0_ARAVE|nr:hypothetical protein AVEN_72747-1 [Araneus ventricosus]